MRRLDLIQALQLKSDLGLSTDGTSIYANGYVYGKNGNPHAEISQLISGYRFTDEEIGATMKQVYNETGYVLDPHGACGYQALIDNKLAPNETGLFLETAHPAKFKESVDEILELDVPLPGPLAKHAALPLLSHNLPADFGRLKAFLLG